MKMRELEAKTGVNRETIRVYLREGLVPEPRRPFRNVADYGEEHVRAVQAVRKLYETSGLTLPQIKAALSGQRSNRQPGASAFQHLEDLVSARVGVDHGLVAVESMLQANPFALIDAQGLERAGVIQLVGQGGKSLVSVTDAGLISIWGRMREVGFDEEHGFPPEIVQFYIAAAEHVAGNEAHLFLERVEGQIDEEEAAAMLEFALPAMLDFFGLLRRKFFLRNIGEQTRASPAAREAMSGPRRKRVTGAGRKRTAIRAAT